MTVSPTATAAGEERGRVCRSEERGQRRCSHSRRRCGAGPGAGQQKLTDVSRPPVYVPACSGLSRNSAAPASQHRNTRARRRGMGGCCVEPPRPSRRGPTSHMVDMVADSLCSSFTIGKFNLFVVAAGRVRRHARLSRRAQLAIDVMDPRLRWTPRVGSARRF